MELHAQEPGAGPWRAVPAAEVVTALLRRRTPGRPVVVAIDGRSAGGKSTTARVLAAAAQEAGERAVVVPTDDVAWWHSFFGWDALLAEGVLAPARRGEAVAYRPPAWDARGRGGAVEVPAGTALLLVEGVGAARRSLAPLLDAAAWVQSDGPAARERGLRRDVETPQEHSEVRDETTVLAFWQEWDAEEVPFLADDRPWERADLVVCGTPGALADPPPATDGDLVVAASSRLLATGGGARG